ncbi:hypothetical protein P43SY_012077 [Pythium insidiosum]|uniref:Uncharacterized protein n=1 Tax=Pythium insidiosum TaxID=114742 RepID=A0AAD5L8J1_PYTIN|nr:hypothetical protein P43SY_012077 [Pythium insidiosum]
MPTSAPTPNSEANPEPAPKQPQAQGEHGDSINATPVKTPTPAGNSVTTRSGTESGTSPVFITMLVLGAVGVVALAVVAAIVKRKKIQDKQNDRDESMMVVGGGVLSFDTMATPTGTEIAGKRDWSHIEEERKMPTNQVEKFTPYLYAQPAPVGHDDELRVRVFTTFDPLVDEYLSHYEA